MCIRLILQNMYTDFAYVVIHLHGKLPMKFTSFLQQFHYTYHRQFSADCFAWSPNWQTAVPAKGK